MSSSPMIVIGITGPIGHGKTTFANALAKVEPRVRHFESSAIIAEVVDAWHATLDKPIDPRDMEAVERWIHHLPDVLHDVLAIDCDFEQIKPDHDGLKSNSVEYQKLLAHVANLQQNFELARTPITPENKETFRPILQWIGGYLVQRVDKTIWYKEVVRRIQLCDPNKVALCTAGGVRFPNEAEALREIDGVVVKVYRPDFDQNDLLDPTERERDGIVVDATIINEGTEEDLQISAAKLLEDIKGRRIQQIYSVANLSTVH